MSRAWLASSQRGPSQGGRTSSRNGQARGTLLCSTLPNDKRPESSVLVEKKCVFLGKHDKVKWCNNAIIIRCFPASASCVSAERREFDPQAVFGLVHVLIRLVSPRASWVWLTPF